MTDQKITKREVEKTNSNVSKELSVNQNLDLEKSKVLDFDICENDDEREKWGNQCEFFLSCLGYAVGFGNVWRFPYLCFKNGGAVFLIPYVIMLFCAGLPLFFMELALGQYVSLGPNIIFRKLSPIFSGLGWAMLVISTFVAIYYNIILAWTFFYTFYTFKAFIPSYTGVLPWSRCDNGFNSLGCFTTACTNGSVLYEGVCQEKSDVCLNGNLRQCIEVDPEDKISASEDFFRNGMLGITGTSWENFGEMRWELVGCLALSWVVVCLCMIKGVKSSGKVVYFTALFPYVVLFILFVRGVTLPGAYQGVEFYFLKPNVTKLAEIEVWNDAATQIFYSLGSSFGGLITLASYNKFNNNCMRDAIVIAFSNCATSVFAGFVIFSILGFMAKELGKEVAEVVSSGSGLAFIAYPEAVTKMPISPLWALLFFTMLITLGLDSQFTMVETLSTAIFDEFKFLRPKKPLVVMLMCFVLFLCGLTMCLQGGIYMFTLFDNFSAGISVIIVAITEIIAIQYIYGFNKFMKNITEDMGIRMPKVLYFYWGATWLVITPASLVIILIISFVYWGPVSFGEYAFPENIQALGWLITVSSIILIPTFAAVVGIKKIVFEKKPWQSLFKRSEDFCPGSERVLRTRLYAKNDKMNYKSLQKEQPHDNLGFVKESSPNTAQVYPSLSGTASTQVANDNSSSLYQSGFNPLDFNSQ